MPSVALRKESVDRNKVVEGCLGAGCVALRKESVDRNTPVSPGATSATRRSPQGERG